MKNCCKVVEKTEQVKKNATSGIFETFALRKGSKWETHFKRKFKEVNRKCEKGEI